jgi:gliding motility-associated-like protein
LKQIDEKLREVLSNKLGNHESEVPAHLWEAIQNGVNSGGAAVASKGVFKLLSGKFIAASLAIIVAATGTLYLINPKAETKNEVSVVKQQPTVPENLKIEANATVKQNEPNPSNRAMEENTPQANKGAYQNILAPNAQQESNLNQQGGDNAIQQPPISQLTPSVSEVTPKRKEGASGPTQIEKNEYTKAPDFTNQTNSLKGAFKILPIDLHLLQYSFVAEDQNATVFTWDFGDETVLTGQVGEHTFEREGTYEVVLTVENSQGLKKSTSQQLEVFAPGEITVPNIFTPNNDGANDTFRPVVKSEGATLTKIIVYDSRGILVFESDGQTFWDGNDMSSNPCASGSYVYYVRGVDRNHEILENKGAITLIR